MAVSDRADMSHSALVWSSVVGMVVNIMVVDDERWRREVEWRAFGDSSSHNDPCGVR